MTLTDQINLELDDVYLDEMEKIVNEVYPELKLDKEVPKELVNKVSDILAEYAK